MSDNGSLAWLFFVYPRQKTTNRNDKLNLQPT